MTIYYENVATASPALGHFSFQSQKADFDATVAGLLRGQSDDGLWDGSPLETTHRLFGLHLTERESNPTIDKGLDALLAAASAPEASESAGTVGAEQLRGLPFAPGVQQAIILPAALFLATIFGRASDPIVRKRFGMLLDVAFIAGRPPDPHG